MKVLALNERLTPNELEMLMELAAWHMERRVPVRGTELSGRLDLQKGTAYYLLNQLRAKGLAAYVDRGYALTVKGAKRALAELDLGWTRGEPTDNLRSFLSDSLDAGSKSGYTFIR